MNMTKKSFICLAGLLVSALFHVGAAAQTTSASKTTWSPLVCFWGLAKCENVSVSAVPDPSVPLTWNKENASAVNPLHIPETADNWVLVGKKDLGDGTMLKIYSDGQVRRETKPGEAASPQAGTVLFNGQAFEAPRNDMIRGQVTDITAQSQMPQDGKSWNGKEWVCPAGQKPGAGGACEACEASGRAWSSKANACACPRGWTEVAGSCAPAPSKEWCAGQAARGYVLPGCSDSYWDRLF
ncbi:hypothetical protein ABIC83_002584 [Roseateles asaccharophilus]|uniref:hypothetical protein n=1 Tax=Roseateles asaccharophilus TaxID=582607 RepID=UPI003833B879